MIWRKEQPPAQHEEGPRGFDDFELRLGDILRGERATLGKSLLDVQRELHIRAAYIAAIENGDLTVEDAVRSSTLLPAQILGLRDRGQIREGLQADLVVFDVKSIRDKSTAAEPHQYSEGIDHVLVGGTFVVENGRPTGALPGKVLRPMTWVNSRLEKAPGDQ